MILHTITGGGDLRLAVHEYGQPQGKPIVLIHGFGQCHLAWSKQYQGSLAEEFRLICLDIRGHGMSDKPADREHYTRDRLWAEDVDAVVTALHLHRPILAGWSYGALIINDYVAHYGEDRVGGINYVAAAVALGVEKAASTIGAPFLEAVPGVCSDNLEDNIRTLRTLLRAMFFVPPSQDDFETALAMSMAVPPAVRLGLVSRVIDRDAVMQAFSVPELVTAAAEDAIILASHTQHLLSCIPHARASIYPGVGHSPSMENPERFNRELAEFARQYAD